MDDPEATNPSTRVRRFTNHLASNGIRVPMEAPLMAVDSTKLNRKIKKYKWKVRLSPAVARPATSRLMRMTLRELNLSKR